MKFHSEVMHSRRKKEKKEKKEKARLLFSAGKLILEGKYLFGLPVNIWEVLVECSARTMKSK